MTIHREIRTTILILLALQLLTSLGAIVLLARTGPAIEQILRENDVSLAAIEQMLEVTALAGVAPVSEAERARFVTALERAEANITEPDEAPILERVRALHVSALEGDATSRTALIGELAALAAINRASMQRADAQARQLASGGAWAAVGLAVLALLLSLRRIRTERERLVVPIHELYEAALAQRKGDRLRRCSVRGMPAELATVGKALNDLLDERCKPSPWPAPRPLDEGEPR